MLRYVFFAFIKLSMLCATLGSVIIVALIYYYAQDLPDYSQLANYHPPAVTRIYSSDGKLIEEYAKEHRIFVPITTIPPSLIEAFVAAEDKSFYEHHGIDVYGVIRAALMNVTHILNHKRMEGGSTITQQVVKNFLLTSERSLPRKIKEAILSYMISKTFSKDKIMELYLNQIYLGHGAYGVAAAAEVYFNKSIEELTMAESAFIAALPKAPSTVNPEKNYDRAIARRNYVLMRMAEDGYISALSAREAMDTKITIVKRDKSSTVTAGYYASKVREEIIKKFGEDFFYQGGLTVITPMNSEYQIEAEKSLRFGIREYDRRRGYRGPVAKVDASNWLSALHNLNQVPSILEYSIAVILKVEDSRAHIGLCDGSKSFIPISEMKWARTNLISARTILTTGDVVVVEKIGKSYALRQIPDVNGAIMAMSPHTGQVIAMVGGYDFNVSKFDRATQGLRQPGSLLKTFTHLAAIEAQISPETKFDDAPISIAQGPGMPSWSPKNFNGDFLGSITMREGLARSRNLITVRIAQAVGLQAVAETIRRFGINKDPKHVWSMILGALESTLDRMISAYGPFANGGFQIKPQFIELIKDSNGKVIYRRDAGLCIHCDTADTLPIISIKRYKRLISNDAYKKINSMLQDVITSGTGIRASVLKKVIGGKTGTTNQGKDVWFVGFTPNILVGTYVGYDSPKSLGKTASGSNIALPIFVNFMESAVLKRVPSISFNDINHLSKNIRFIDNPNTDEVSEESDDIFQKIDHTSKQKMGKIINNNHTIDSETFEFGVY